LSTIEEKVGSGRSPVKAAGKKCPACTALNAPRAARRGYTWARDHGESAPVIPVEQAKLSEAFEEYDAYRAGVPRWL
jgi:hypothetical protein